jgi:hypothetical protein
MKQGTGETRERGQLISSNYDGLTLWVPKADRIATNREIYSHRIADSHPRNMFWQPASDCSDCISPIEDCPLISRESCCVNEVEREAVVPLRFVPSKIADWLTLQVGQAHNFLLNLIRNRDDRQSILTRMINSGGI